MIALSNMGPLSSANTCDVAQGRARRVQAASAGDEIIELGQHASDTTRWPTSPIPARTGLWWLSVALRNAINADVSAIATGSASGIAAESSEQVERVRRAPAA